MELRSWLSVAEAHLDQVRDRIHQATAPGRHPQEVGEEDLSVDVQWLAAAGAARARYARAITDLLHTMPAPSRAALAPVPQATRLPQPPATVRTSRTP